MTETILKSIIELLIITPIMVLSIDRKKPNKWLLLSLFYSFFILNGILLELPRKINGFQLIDGNWNWTGKVYAVIVSVIFKFDFRDSSKYNYILYITI